MVVLCFCDGMREMFGQQRTVRADTVEIIGIKVLSV